MWRGNPKPFQNSKPRTGDSNLNLSTRTLKPERLAIFNSFIRFSLMDVLESDPVVCAPVGSLYHITPWVP